MKTLKKFAGWLCIATVLGLGVAMIAYPAAVTQVAGLAIAQTSTQWNQLKDMAVGDAQQNGSGLMTPCLWNGLTCDRQRGSIANGAQVDVTRLGGASTPSDAFANPTTTNVVWVLESLFNGTTWDRVRSAISDSQAVTGIQGTASMLWNQATSSFDRNRGGSAAIQLGTLLNTTTTSAVATANTVTITGAASTRVHIYRIGAYCSAGTSTLTIQDGATTIFTGPTGGVGTIPFLNGNIPVVVAYTMTTGNNGVVSLTSCGAGNTSTLNIQADRF